MGRGTTKTPEWAHSLVEFAPKRELLQIKSRGKNFELCRAGLFGPRSAPGLG